MTGVMMVPALLVEIARDMDVSVAVAGQLTTASFAAWAVSIIAVGPLADSIGRRPLALAGVFFVVVSLVSSAFAPNIETLMFLRALAGLGGGAIAPTSIGVISDVISPARRAQAHRRSCQHHRVDLGHQRPDDGVVRGLVGAGGSPLSWPDCCWERRCS